MANYDEYIFFLNEAAQVGIDVALANHPAISPVDGNSLRCLAPGQLMTLGNIHQIVRANLGPAQVDDWQCNLLC